MKIAILSRNSRLYSTARLVAAARARGHRVRVLDPLRCYMRIAHDGFTVHYGGRPLRGIDAVIPRIGASVTFYGTAVLRQFEMMGVYTPSPSDAVLRARDKLRSLQILASQGIDLPVTVFGDNPDDTADLINMLGPPPHVIKLNEGAQGAGVVLAEKPAASQSVIEAFRGLYANFLVQQFVREAEGRDIRCFVVGERVVAAMQRAAMPGDFRANLHRGGTGSVVKLSAAERLDHALRRRLLFRQHHARALRAFVELDDVRRRAEHVQQVGGVIGVVTKRGHRQIDAVTRQDLQAA